MSTKLEQPSKFCESECGFVKRRDFDTCFIYGNCWHLQDKEINPPVKTKLYLPNNRVELITIVGENNVFQPMWYLDDGTGIIKRNPWTKP